MSEMISHPSVVWLLLAVVLAIMEFVARAFAFVFGAAAAVIAAIAAIYIVSWELQTAIFAAAAMLGLLVVRPRCVSAFQKGAKGVPSRTDSLVGKIGIVTQSIEPIKIGRIEVDGQDWAARSQQLHAVGESVLVESADGIVLNVRSPNGASTPATTSNSEA